MHCAPSSPRICPPHSALRLCASPPIGIPGFASFLASKRQAHTNNSTDAAPGPKNGDEEHKQDDTSGPTSACAAQAEERDVLISVDLGSIAAQFLRSRPSIAEESCDQPPSSLAPSVARPPDTRLTLLVDTFAVLMHLTSAAVASGALPPLFFLLPDYTHYRRLIAWIEGAFAAVHVRLVWYTDTAGIGSTKSNENRRRTEEKVRSNHQRKLEHARLLMRLQFVAVAWRDLTLRLSHLRFAVSLLSRFSLWSPTPIISAATLRPDPRPGVISTRV